MTPVPEKEIEKRVLLIAPTSRDAELTQSLLAKAGLACVVCRDLHEASSEVSFGAGAVLLTEEVTKADDISEFLTSLDEQAPWSDLPVVMLMRGGVQSPVATRVLNSLKNVTLLERPTSTRTVVSAVRAAVRNRERQYQIREQIDEIRRADEERERLLESERSARSEAERANRSKDEFLAVLSHELKSPLNSISMAVQLLQMNGISHDEQVAMLRTIAQGVRVQNQLIEDLLDVSRIVSGKLHLDDQTFDLRNVIDSALMTARKSAEAKKLEVIRDLPDAPLEVRGDQARMQQVVWNLLSNAVKFTPEGGRITIKVCSIGAKIELSITDSGCGISPSFLPHVFDRFRQAGSATTRRHGGLGLGLSIVRQLVQLHGGSITVKSDGEGSGSTFTVSLPRALSTVSENSRRLDRHEGDLEGLKVLVVDDDRDFVQMMQRLLSEYRAQVMSACSTEEALKCVEEFRPDLLVSDVGMPIVDGYEFIRQVRSQGKSAAELPAAAVTAFAGADDRKRALLAGFQGHIAKPVNGNELIALLASLAGRTGSSSSKS